MPDQKPKFACFISVRTSSNRLPNKAILPIRGKMVIEHLIERIKLVRGADLLVLCTSREPADDILEETADRQGIFCFRGSLKDKIARWLGAAEKFDVDYFVKVDGDDLFCDPELIDLAIANMKESPCDFLQAPPGLVSGGFAFCVSTKAVRRVFDLKDTDDTDLAERYFTDLGIFKIRDLEINDPAFFAKNIRLTLDYKEDLELFKKIFDGFGTSENIIPLRKIIRFLSDRPQLAEINFFRESDYLANQKKMLMPKIKKPARTEI